MMNSHGAEFAPMALLAAGIPLSLIIDLALDAGPDSRAILEAERRADG